MSRPCDCYCHTDHNAQCDTGTQCCPTGATQKPIKRRKKSKLVGAQFCWDCGLQLRQRKIFEELVLFGYPRRLHKDCAKKIKKRMKNGERYEA